MKILIFILAFVFTSSTHLNTQKWGKTGHRVVGAIAEEYLTDDAEDAIDQILGDQSMAIASIWMDQIKSDSSWDYTHPWHWVTIAPGKTYRETPKNPESDIIKAIRTIIDDLKAGNLSAQDEAQKLKMLIHLIGDIHMPLHVGNGKDRGGNAVDVTWFWDHSNLHRVWDSGIINETLLSYTELTESINHPTKEQINQWQNSTVLDWAYESRALHDAVYDLPEDHEINYDYMYHNYPIIQKRLLQAGVRLAGVLNEIYG